MLTLIIFIDRFDPTSELIFCMNSNSAGTLKTLEIWRDFWTDSCFTLQFRINKADYQKGSIPADEVERRHLQVKLVPSGAETFVFIISPNHFLLDPNEWRAASLMVSESLKSMTSCLTSDLCRGPKHQADLQTEEQS